MARNLQLEIIIKVIDKATAQVKKVNQELEKNRQVMRKARKDASLLMQKYLGIGLSMLFVGMAIRRFAETALRGMINTYVRIMEENEMFNSSVQRLQAAWTFLQFAIMDALMQSPLFMAMIEFIINLIDWISGLPASTRKWIGVLIIILIVLGTIMMIGGQILIFMMAWRVLTILNTVASAPLLGIWGILALVILIIIAVIVILFVLWKSGLTKTQKLILTVIIVLIALIIILILIGLLPVTWPIILALAVLAMIGLIVLFKDKFFLILLKLASKLLDFFQNIGKWIIEFMLFPLKGFISLANKILKVLGKGSIQIPTIAELVGNVAAGAKSAIDRRIAEQEALIARKEAEKANQPGLMDRLMGGMGGPSLPTDMAGLGLGGSKTQNVTNNNTFEGDFHIANDPNMDPADFTEAMGEGVAEGLQRQGIAGDID